MAAARKRRGLGSDDSGGKFSVLCYFTRLLSDGLDEAKSFASEPEALKFAKTCVKTGKGMNPHAVVNNPYGGTSMTVVLTRTGRLQVKK